MLLNYLLLLDCKVIYLIAKQLQFFVVVVCNKLACLFKWDCGNEVIH